LTAALGHRPVVALALVVAGFFVANCSAPERSGYGLKVNYARSEKFCKLTLRLPGAGSPYRTMEQLAVQKRYMVCPFDSRFTHVATIYANADNSTCPQKSMGAWPVIDSKLLPNWKADFDNCSNVLGGHDPTEAPRTPVDAYVLEDGRRPGTQFNGWNALAEQLHFTILASGLPIVGDNHSNTDLCYEEQKGIDLSPTALFEGVGWPVPSWVVERKFSGMTCYESALAIANQPR
jgi:hypothetical protein